MKFRSIAMLMVLIFSMAAASAQDFNYVDVKETNEQIARLERANDNHRNRIAANGERKTFLENRIQTSEARLVKIEENLEYAQETNLELNSIRRETKDRETLDRLDASRAELMSVIWILKTEQTELIEQTASDKEEVEFLTGDTARRESIVGKNEEEIAALQKAVSETEAKISEVSSKLDTIISRLEGLREEASSNE